MNRIARLSAVLMCPAFALIQSHAPGQGTYQPAVPPPTVVTSNGGGGYWGGGSHASTAAEGAMNGMANVISAQGNYNLATSAAAVNMTQVQRNEIENRQLWTNTYFQMRATNQAARDAARKPPPTMEQLARMSKTGAPKPLSTSQLDPVSGRVDWPGALQLDTFSQQREELEKLFAKRAEQGGLDYADQSKARKTLNDMSAGLKAQIKEIPPQVYSDSSQFLRSLAYAAGKTDLN